eukprot:m51a1_g14184 hypothetical protein (388) ;mRNA; f:65999-67162
MGKAASTAALIATLAATASALVVSQSPDRGQVVRRAERFAIPVVYTYPEKTNVTQCFVMYSVVDNFGAPWTNVQTQELHQPSGPAWMTNLTMPTGTSVLEFVGYCIVDGQRVYPEGQGNGAFEPATRPRFDVLVADGYTRTLNTTVTLGTTSAFYTVDAVLMPYEGPKPIPGLRCFAWYAFLAKHGDPWTSPRAAQMMYKATWGRWYGMIHDEYVLDIAFPEDGTVLEATSYCEYAGRRVWNSGARCHYDHEPAAELVQVAANHFLSKNVVTEASRGSVYLTFRSKALPLSPIRPATGLKCFAHFSFVDSFGGEWKSPVTQEMYSLLGRYGHERDRPEDLPYERWGLDIAMPVGTKLEATGFCTLNHKTLWVEGQGNFLFQNTGVQN